MNLSKIVDTYDLRARLFPGLLVLLPIAVFFYSVFGQKNPFFGATISLIIACGGPYALASIVRTRGQRAQERLYLLWGGRPTTILLRHRDKRLSTHTKKRYHELIAAKFNLEVPSLEQEQEDKSKADSVYTAATDQLIALTRDSKKFPLVFKELVAYGFNRNGYGVRWIGTTVSLLTIALTIIHARIITLELLSIDIAAISGISVENAVTLVVSTLLLSAWLFHFTGSTVKQSGFSYAERLHEALNAETPKDSYGRTH